jgi:hypothetical protein
MATLMFVSPRPELTCAAAGAAVVAGDGWGPKDAVEADADGPRDATAEREAALAARECMSSSRAQPSDQQRRRVAGRQNSNEFGDVM